MHETSITFFDIPTRNPSPNSPNTWKVRLVLNFKHLKYQTCWVPTTEIERTCRSLHIPPTSKSANGKPHYTLPALIDYTASQSSPRIISDSTAIIEYLETTYPTSEPLFPRGTRAFHAMFEQFLAREILKFFPSLWLMALYRSKLRSDQVHFRKRTERTFGKRLEDIESKGLERERAWNDVEKAFGSLAGFLAKNGQGKWVMGTQISFSDFALCSCMIFLKNISPEENWEQHIAVWDGGRWARHLAVCEKWMAVDGYPLPSSRL